MSVLIVFKKLTLQEAINMMRGVEEWFRSHPKKKVCKTDLFQVRKGYIVQDILKHTQQL